VLAAGVIALADGIAGLSRSPDAEGAGGCRSLDAGGDGTAIVAATSSGNAGDGVAGTGVGCGGAAATGGATADSGLDTDGGTAGSGFAGGVNVS
jgi:hypothetical protein